MNYCSGINISEGLQLMCNDGGRKISKLGSSLVEEIEGGNTLNQAINLNKDYFNNFYVSMVQLGEKCGKLENTLRLLSTYYLKQFQITSKFKKALSYPILLLSFTLVLGTLVISKLIPIICNTILGIGGTISSSLAFLLKTSRFITSNVLLEISILSFLVALFNLIKGNIGFRRVIDKFIFKIPLIGILISRNMQINIVNAMTMALESGADIIETMECIIDMNTNMEIVEKLQTIKMLLRQGKGISICFTSVKLLNPWCLSMIRVGEQGGCLTEALSRVSEVLQEELDNDFDKLMVYLEPVITLLIAAFIGFLVLTVVTSFTSLMNQMGGV